MEDRKLEMGLMGLQLMLTVWDTAQTLYVRRLHRGVVIIVAEGNHCPRIREALLAWD